MSGAWRIAREYGSDVGGQQPGFEPISWREFIAVGIVAGDLSPATIARCVGKSLPTVEAALKEAREAGVLGHDGVDPVESVRLVGELAPGAIAQVHYAMASHLLIGGPENLVAALEHVRVAWELAPSDELLSLASLTAETSLSVGEYEAAYRCLAFLTEAEPTSSSAVRSQRLCRLAEALDGLGRVDEARRHLAAAFHIADLEGDADCAVDAAVQYVLPVDWYAGDRRATAQLQRAELLARTEDQIVKLRAASAMAEMRIPVPGFGAHQVAWVTRPSVAQPLAEDALMRSERCDPRTRLLALIAWRTTHRAPEFLPQRVAISSEMFDLAQRLGNAARMVDAAVMLGVDLLEAGDRAGFDQALTVLRWVAEVDANPRLVWHARAVAGGVAHFDGDVDIARIHRDKAREVGSAVGIPGWFGADLMLLSQELLAIGDADEIARHLPDDDGAEVMNALGKLIVGLGHARVGAMDRAEVLLRLGVRQFDAESSWLLCHTRAAELAVCVGADDIADELFQALEPWHDRVAVDSQAWLIDGAVSGWLALLADYRGDVAACRRYLHHAMLVARRMGDMRGVARLEALSSRTGLPTVRDSDGSESLTERELQVLQFVVDGWSNPQIAEAMAFSRSTIRNSLSAIYRKLGVSSRVEASAHAVRMGLCRPPDGGAQPPSSDLVW